MQEISTKPLLPPEVVKSVISVRPGDFYSMRNSRMALQEAFTLAVRAPVYHVWPVAVLLRRHVQVSVMLSSA
jgi:hypothetical protein